MRLNKVQSVLILIFSFVIFGCASKLNVVKNLNFIPGEKTLTIAVLPFMTQTVKGEEVLTQVREEVTANLYEGNYRILEIAEIDHYLSQKGITKPDGLVQGIRNKKVNFSQDCGADILIQGRVIEWTKTYLALHSDIELDVELFVFDARKGKMIAKIRKGVIHNSGITRLPTGYISAGTAPLLGLKKSVQQDVIHTLTREISQPLLELNEKSETKI